MLHVLSMLCYITRRCCAGSEPRPLQNDIQLIRPACVTLESSVKRWAVNQATKCRHEWKRHMHYRTHTQHTHTHTTFFPRQTNIFLKWVTLSSFAAAAVVVILCSLSPSISWCSSNIKQDRIVYWIFERVLFYSLSPLTHFLSYVFIRILTENSNENVMLLKRGLQ